MTTITEAVPATECTGVQPLTARWEPWMDALTSDPARCGELVDRYGSPVHVHEPSSFHRNIDQLRQAAASRQVALGIFFARKANKCITYVDEARNAGIGVDVAGEIELRQALSRNVAPSDLIVTSALKPRALLELCLEHGVCVAIDNEDEAAALIDLCRERDTTARVAIRLHGFRYGARTLESRFGLAIDDVPGAVRRWAQMGDRLQIEGLHFHLDGYAAADRVIALDAALEIAEGLRHGGAPTTFIDIGGGFPMSYLDSEAEWDAYWRALEAAVVGDAQPITYRNESFGLIEHDGRVLGRRQAYPHAQSPVGGDWLGSVLDSPRPSDPSTTIADVLRAHDLRLHCEPGRSLLDGCGMTLARVEHRKKVGDDWLIGLHMNSSNCRSRKSELFADPRLVATSTLDRPADDMVGYLTGAYCTESDLIMHRRLEFPGGVAVGDLLAFPNTAGYLMHFVESRSHQFELPLNVVLGADGPTVDPIDR